MRVIGIRFLIVFSLLLAAGSTYAQSSDQMFPTPIRTSEIASSIKARAIGDPRVTTYYYTFEGRQGDVFINVQSKNFSGDIDVYAIPSQQPLTKIVIYGDQPEAETGRVIYLRKPERLLLRIQGRSPGDDDASVRIKFAGNFSASTLDEGDNPAVPKVETNIDSNVRVNSVGTILEVIPKATPTPDSARLGDTPEPHEPSGTVGEKKLDEREEPKVEADHAKSVQVLVTDPVIEEKKEDPPKSTTTPRNRNRRRASTATAKVVPPAETRDEKKEDAEQPTSESRSSITTKDKAPKVDPMAGINLVIYFKDGSRIDRPMTEVQRFSVERAVLTVISKNGTIGRYNMTEVSRVSIE